MKVFTAFSGYDSQCMALDRLHSNFNKFNYELVGWSEIDKYAIQAHNVIYPQYKDRNYGDISKINWDKVDDFDLLTYSSPCFVGNTLVLTLDGYKEIKNISKNDYVITNSNSFHKVIEPMVRHFNGELYKIDAMCTNIIECTPEHPFYVRNMYRKGHLGIRTFRDPVFKKANELTKKDYLGIAIDNRSEFPIWDGVEDNRWGHHRISNKLSNLFSVGEFWYIMGRYIGDGWKKETKVTKAIIICGDDKKMPSLIKALDFCGFHYTIMKERTVNKVQVSSKELFEFVSRYGYYAYGKRIDGETIGLPKELLKYFIKGYLESDGCFTNGLYKISSVSRELIYGIAQCIAKSYQVPYKIYFCKRKSTCNIEGRTVNQRDTWQICWKERKGKQDNAFFENGNIWFPIRSITCENKECEVYNMEVEDDHTYTANGAIVHNCQDFSAAGLQRGGIRGSGTRSSLLWECERAIEAKRPKYLLMENVAALVSKKFIKLFNKWQFILNGYGYINYAQVLNAKDYGVPQNRERIFMVSIRNDITQRFFFPKPFILERRLKDVLEENVDEKFYLSDKLIKGFMKHNEHHLKKGTGFIFSPKSGENIASCIRSNAALCPTDNTIIEPFNSYKKVINRTIKDQYSKSSFSNFIRKDGLGATGVIRFCNINPSGKGMNEEVYDTNGVSPTITTNKGEGIKFINPSDKQANRVLSPESQISQTLSVMQGGNTQPKIIEPIIEENIVGISVHPFSHKLEFNGKKSIKTDTAPALRATDYKAPSCLWINSRIRRLTPTECFRLMDVSDKDIHHLLNSGISNSQLYKLAGNSIVVNCLYHIFRKLFVEKQNEGIQTELF